MTRLTILGATLLALAGAGGSVVVAQATNGPPGTGHDPVTICHKPGTPAAHTITVDDDAELQGHLAHGDTRGACETETTPTGTTTTGTTTTETETTPTQTMSAPPTGTTCVYTGAGKDGEEGNDACAVRPTPPAPPAAAVTPTSPTPVTTTETTPTTPEPLEPEEGEVEPDPAPVAKPKPDKAGSPPVNGRCTAYKDAAKYEATGRCYPAYKGHPVLTGEQG